MFKFLLFLLLALIQAGRADDLPSQEQIQNGGGEAFKSPDGNLYILSFDDSNNGCFIQLRESSGKKVITSLHLTGKLGVDFSWSPDSQKIAIVYKIRPTNRLESHVYLASGKDLSEINIPAGLSLKSLLPPSDPAWKLPIYHESIRPGEWEDANHLSFNVEVTFRDAEKGYFTVTYEVLTELKDNHFLQITSSKQTGYSPPH